MTIAQLSRNVIKSRTERIADITETVEWDLVIIGGGITGAGILKLACQMGLKVLLLEQKDFAWGSSSRSSKMVHGGLRYMAQGQVALTRESVEERKRLLKEGQPLVTKQSFVLSHYEKVYPSPWLFNCLLYCYDFIAGETQHKFWPKKQYLALAPKVVEHNLLGGTQFFDALTEDARLVQRLIQESLHLGGQALNYAQVSALNINEKNSQLSVVFEGQEQALVIKSKVVVNACGAWSNLLQVNHDEQSHSPKSSSVNMRPLRGSHLVIANWRLPVASVISVQHAQDKRPVQIYPWQNVTIVGTTDVDHQDDMAFEAKISQSEFDYLLAAIEQQFPNAKISKDDIISTFAGVRPLSTAGNSLTPSKEKRDHRITQQQGVFTVTGGKLTTFRLIAHQVLSKVCQQLTLHNKANELILSNALNLASQQPILSQHAGVEALLARSDGELKQAFSYHIQLQIMACYGEFSAAFIKASVKADCQPIRYSRHLWAELVWAARFEQVQHLDDLLLRRTRLGNILPFGASEILPQVKALCSPYLSWSDEKWQQEIKRYLAIWQRSYSLPQAEESSI